MLNSNLVEQLAKEAERIEEDSLFSGKGHYNAVPCWVWSHRILGVAAAVSSAIAGLSILKHHPIFSASMAAVSSIVAVILTTLKPSEHADRHQRAGDSYFAVKNKARIFRCIELVADGATEESVIQSLKRLSESLAGIRSGAPTIPRYAYEKAVHDIEVVNTAQHRVDKPSQ